jgi:hypothetical protein
MNTIETRALLTLLAAYLRRTGDAEDAELAHRVETDTFTYQDAQVMADSCQLALEEAWALRPAPAQLQG